MTDPTLQTVQNLLADARRAAQWDRYLVLLSDHWSMLFQQHPDELLALLAAVPPEVVARNSGVRFAEEYLRGLLGGAQSSESGGEESGEDTADAPLDRLAAATHRVRIARMDGRYLDAMTLAEQAAGILREASADDVAAFAAALPEFHYHWGLAFLVVDRFDAAMKQFAQSYDWAGSVGNHMVAARSAGAVALVHAFHGRGRDATAWLLKRPRIPPDAWWAAAARLPGTLAEALLHIGRLELDIARVLLAGIDIADGLDYWAMYYAIRAFLTPHDDAPARRLLAEFVAFVGALGPEHAYNPLGAEFSVVVRYLLLRLIDQEEEAARTLGPTRVDPSSSLVQQVQAVLHARRLVRLGRPYEAREMLDSLRHVSSKRPRIFISALLVAAETETGEARTELLGRVVDLAASHLCHESWAFASPEVRRELGEVAYAHGDVEIAERLRAMEGGIAIAGSDSLTLREAAMVQAALSGKSNVEISLLHHVSVNTVKTHIRHAYRKLGVTSREELQQRFHVGEPARPLPMR